jgi:hypothetical protein
MGRKLGDRQRAAIAVSGKGVPIRLAQSIRRHPGNLGGEIELQDLCSLSLISGKKRAAIAALFQLECNAV